MTKAIQLAEKIKEHQDFLMLIFKEKYDEMLQFFKDLTLQISEKKSQKDYIKIADYLLDHVEKKDNLTEIEKTYHKGFIAIAAFELETNKNKSYVL